MFIFTPRGTEGIRGQEKIVTAKYCIAQQNGLPRQRDRKNMIDNSIN